MFTRFRQNIVKLYRLLATGEYQRIVNAIKLRFDRLIHGKENSQRTEVELCQRELSRVLRKYFDCDNTYQTHTTKVALILRGGSIMPQSSAFIRLIAPLTHPSVRDTVSVKLYPENTVDIDEETDVCIVQRTAFDSIRTAKRLVKKLHRDNIKMVLDTDDAFSMLESNHSQYREQVGRIKGVKHVLEHADQVWVSTQVLADLYGNREHHVVMPNMLDSRIWQKNQTKPRRIPANSQQPLQLVCMGTATHDDDLEMIMPALEEVAYEHPGTFELTLIGVTDGVTETSWLKRIRQPKFGAMYPNFVRWFLKQGPFDIGLSPLRDTEFNRSKSDIKCLDYLAAGMVPMGSDITPYQGDISSYIIRVPNTHKEWVEHLKTRVLHPREFRQQRNQITYQARRYIWQHRSSEKAAYDLENAITHIKNNG